jgi:hypothetical protein
VEKILAEQREGRRKAQARRLAEIRKNLPASAYERALDSDGLPEGLGQALTADGLESIGQAYERAMLDPDSILTLPEVGARNFEKLKGSLENIILDLRADEKAEEEQAAAERAQEAAAEAEGPHAEAAEEAEAVIEAATAEAAVETEEAVAETDAAEAVIVPVVEGEEEEEEEEEDKSAKKKKKGKVKAVVEFDPETGMMVTRRKRKPGRTKDWTEGGLDEE